MKLTQMRQVLTEEGIQLTKSLGQNFLHDANQLKKIAQAGMLSREDTVLEVGPGLGPLTAELLELAGRVVAVEMDQRLIEFLEKRFTGNDRLQLIHSDAVKYIRERPDWHLWKVVSNLPYSVGSPIMVDLAMAEKPPLTMVMTVQLEVAKRISAPCNAPDYGILSLLIQQAYKPKSWFKIPSRCFFPVPGVDSACVILERRDPPLLSVGEKPVFMKLVKQGFSQRRKMMLKLLKQLWPEPLLLEAFKRLGLSPQARAETVTLKQFAELARILFRAQPIPQLVLKTAPVMSEERFDVVDERDQVIGQEFRRIVHQRGLRHRAVHILLFNARGELFLQQRSQFKDMAPNTWDSSSSGHLNPGESYDDGAVRELKEELGVALPCPLQPLFKIDSCSETGQEFVWVYRGDHEGPFQLHPEEIQAGNWFSRKQIVEWIRAKPSEFAPALPYILSRLWPEDFTAHPEMPATVPGSIS